MHRLPWFSRTLGELFLHDLRELDALRELREEIGLAHMLKIAKAKQIKKTGG